jgi:hypothetical protein
MVNPPSEGGSSPDSRIDIERGGGGRERPSVLEDAPIRGERTGAPAEGRASARSARMSWLSASRTAEGRPKTPDRGFRTGIDVPDASVLSRCR